MIYDVAIIGAGIAGASLAAEIAPFASVLLLEAEDQPGYHATGRSAAFWNETYGGVHIQPLTTASGPWLENPPPEFSETGFLHRRGALYLGHRDEADLMSKFVADFQGSEVLLERLSREQAVAQVHGLRPEWCEAVLERNCADIDVAALHGAYLRLAKQLGVDLECRARVAGLTRVAEVWAIGAHRARVVVNAAGAWADDVARMAGVKPLGITAYRRTIAQLRVSPPAPADLPVTFGIAGDFYFKPEGGGRIWLSPHDETETPPCDAAAEELDIAVAIDRFQHVTDWKVEAVEHSWAGLRSFAPDRLPVYGFDGAVEGFFWCAGQGGFGIQTAPAAAKLAAALLLSRDPEKMVAHIEAALFSPTRFI